MCKIIVIIEVVVQMLSTITAIVISSAMKCNN